MIWIIVAIAVAVAVPSKPKEIQENKEVITRDVAETNENSVSKQ